MFPVTTLINDNAQRHKFACLRAIKLALHVNVFRRAARAAVLVHRTDAPARTSRILKMLRRGKPYTSGIMGAGRFSLTD